MQKGTSGDSEISWDGGDRVREPDATVYAAGRFPGSVDIRDFRRNTVGGQADFRAGSSGTTARAAMPGGPRPRPGHR
ncbi:hypothetical protein GZL_09362 [Streptomyces sp. 769]|nr:hypothetical protein GZL_00051 [Streptomyces sp. 769]AJC61880.1 hypothetical protein GZL_09362 [Streptomyces sp. 769]